jgi:ABC-2 type transport system permease protein
MTAPALRPYAAVVRTRFQLLLQYRAAALAGFATQCWWGTIKVMVLTAFFAGASTTPMSLRQTITYVWLAQAFLMLLPWTTDSENARMIRTGDIAYERLRPIDSYWFWFSRAVARRTATPLLRAVPMVVAVGVLLPLLGLSEWGMSPPAGVEAALFFTLSMALVVALSSAISTLMDSIAMAMLDERGVNMVAGPLVTALSGALVPLALLPEWLQPVLRLQPFSGLVDTPFRIYGGNLTGFTAAAGLVHQAVWTVAFIGLGRFIMSRVMARVQVQGG